MDKDEQLMIRYLSTSQNRLRLVINLLQNRIEENLNATVEKQQAESSPIVSIFIEDILNQINTISDLRTQM